MPITDLSDEELKSLYKPQNEQSSGISSVSDEELMRMYKPEQTRTYPNQPVKNMTEEEFKQNVDKLYNIPQVDIPQRGVLVNSSGEVKKGQNINKNLTPEKQAEIARIKAEYEARNREIDRQHRQALGRIGLGATMQGLSALPINKIPIVGSALGGALFDAGGAIMEGASGKEILQRAGRGAAAGATVEGAIRAIPIVGKPLSQSKVGRTVIDKSNEALKPLLESNVAKNISNVLTKEITVGKPKPQVAKPQTQVIKEVKAELVEQPQQLALDFNKVDDEVVPETNIIQQAKKQILENNLPNYDDAYIYSDNGHGYLRDQIENMRDVNYKYNELLKNLEKQKNDYLAKAKSEQRVKKINEAYNQRVKEANESLKISQENIIKNIDNYEKEIGIAPSQFEQPTGETKLRSLPQSVLEAKGTPKEVKEIIKQDMPTYQVLHNKDLTAQASDELAGNFDNELVRLASAKDFDALDYEKSRQIAKTLFDNGDYQRAVDLIDNVSENATKKGQAIQALSLWSNMSPEGAVYKAQKLVKEYNKKNPKKPIQLTDENIDTIRKLQSDALNTVDKIERNQAMARSAKYMTDLIPKGFVKKLKAYRNIAMLLNPKTLGRNIVGNVVFNVTDTGSKGLAALIDRGLSKFTGQRTRVAPDLGTYGKGLVQGAKTGYKEALQGIDTRGLGQRYDLGSGRMFDGGNTERTTIADIIKAQKGNKLNTTEQYFKELLPKSRIGQAISQKSLQPLENIPSDLMNSLETALDVGLRTPDRAFYEATFAESVQNMMKANEPQREIIRKELQKKLARAKSEKSIERINKKLADLDKPTQEILERAEQEALESVFQNKSNVSDLALGLRSGLNKIGTQDFGLGDVLIPYAQTPANLTQQAINYSPLGLIKGGWNLSKGDQRQAGLDIARSLIGSGLIGGGYGLAKAGLTTPSQFDENYTRNKAIRENLQPLGIRPDQLGNMWYAPFQPMSSPIATGTAMAYGDNPIFAGLNTVVDQPYLQGVTRGLRDLQEGNWADAGINVISSIPSQFVPTLASQFAQSIDPYQRQTYDPNKLQYGLNSAIAKIPFASKTLPERIDVTGQPVERYSSKGAKRLFDIFLNPTFINEKTDDPVLSELKYIYDQTKKTSHFMPTVDRTLDFTDVDGNNQKIKLTGRELSEYQRELGQRMYDEFNYVMDLPEYTNTDDYGKIELLEKAKKLVKDEVDNEMWNKKKQYKKSSYTKGN